VAWSSRGQKGGSYSNRGIFAQRFDSLGQRQGAEFQVNTFTFFRQYAPNLVHDSQGNFVVVWASAGQDVYYYEGNVAGRRFRSNGAPIGDEFRVSSSTFNNEYRPSIANDSTGNFVVVWASPGQGFAVNNIIGRRFDSSATPIGGDFRVDTSTSYNAWLPTASFDSVGNFVVAWTSYLVGSRFEVLARRFDHFATPLANDFVVNTTTTQEQTYPVLFHDPAGNFLVVWESTHLINSGWDVFARRFIVDAVASGAARGGQSSLRVLQSE
jgi:hypothetical protein